MTHADTKMILAIDGGGTRCRVALGRRADMLSVETGSANVSTDFDASLHQIKTGLAALAEKSGLSLDRLARAPAFIGLAGVTGPDIARRLREALPFSCLRIEDDRPAAVRGALGARDGVIAHCGTGSFYGAQIAGGMAFSGGWGPVLGDEASALWIGRAVLGLTLETVDGRLEPTALATRLLDNCGGAPGIVRFAGAARPSDIAALAPEVTSHAQKGDALGLRIMSGGAAEITRSLKAIGWAPGRAVCLTGGVGPHYAPYLPEDIRADISPPEGEPLAGALSLARDLSRENAV